MSNIEKIEKLMEQYNKEIKLIDKCKKKAKEQMDLAEKHEKKATDLQNEIKYQKGEEVYDRVNALQLTAEELNLVLKLLDDKAQLLDIVQMLFPERIQNPKDAGQKESISEDSQESVSGKEEYTEEVPVFGEDDGIDGEDEKGDEETWIA